MHNRDNVDLQKYFVNELHVNPNAKNEHGKTVFELVWAKLRKQGKEGEEKYTKFMNRSASLFKRRGAHSHPASSSSMRSSKSDDTEILNSSETSDRMRSRP